MDELFKTIWKMEGDNKQLLDSLTEVNSKFKDQNEELKKQQVHLKTLQDRETELLRGRAAAQNPTAIVKYNKALEENKKKIDEVKKATEDLTVTEQKAGKTTEDLGKKINTAFDTTSIRGQLRQLKEQLAKTGDDKEFLRLSVEAGKLEDKIGDAREAAAIFATDSPFKAVGNGIRAVSADLLSMDFEGAAAKSKLLVSATKQITFSSALQGMKDLGTTLLNVGKSLLMNPIFLIGTAITLIISNFDKLKSSGGLVGKMFTAIGDTINFVIDGFTRLTDAIGLTDIAASKTIEKSIKALNMMQEMALGAINNRYNVEIARARASGKEITEIEIAKRQAMIQTYEDAIKAQFALVDGSEASIQRATAFERTARQQINSIGREIDIMILERNKKASDEEKKASDERIKRMLDFLGKRDEDERYYADKRLQIEQAENDAKIADEVKTAEEFRKKNEEFDKNEEQDRKEENNRLRQHLKEQAEIEKQAAEAAEAKRKQLVQQQIDQIGTITSATLNAASLIISAEALKYDKLATLQEKQVDKVRDIADKGNAELLELEQKRLDDLNQQREQFVRRQQALAVIELIANTAIAVSKAAAQGGVAAGVTIAAALIALTGGLIQARSIASQAAFYEGGYTGDGDPKQESQNLGRKAYKYHKGEFVMNHEKTAKYKDIFQDIHKGHIDLHDWKNKVEMFEAMKLYPIGGGNLDTVALEKKVDQLIMTISNQSTSVNLDENGLAMRFQNIKSRNELIKGLARA